MIMYFEICYMANLIVNEYICDNLRYLELHGRRIFELYFFRVFFFFQAEDGIRDVAVTGVQTCALPIFEHVSSYSSGRWPTRKPSFPLRAPHGGIPAIRVLPTFSKRDEKASHHPPFRIHRNRIQACVCPRLSLRQVTASGLRKPDLTCVHRHGYMPWRPM